MKKEYKYLIPLIVLFAVISIFCLAAPSVLTQWNVDINALLIGNLIFFVTAFINFTIQLKALGNKNSHVFIRSIMGTMLIKMVVVMVCLFIYWKLSGPAFSKTTVIVGVGLYLIYFITGVYCIMQLNKKPHA